MYLLIRDCTKTVLLITDCTKTGVGPYLQDNNCSSILACHTTGPSTISDPIEVDSGVSIFYDLCLWPHLLYLTVVVSLIECKFKNQLKIITTTTTQKFPSSIEFFGSFLREKYQAMPTPKKISAPSLCLWPYITKTY